MDNTIALENIGPNHNLKIGPVSPGVSVLRGPNGAGKSLALDGVSRLFGNEKSKPPVSDGKRRGSVEGFGARITVGAKITSAGELEATSLEGAFDLATLVDPGIQSPASADAKRIKALLSLVDHELDQRVFRELVGDAYDSLAIDDSDDIVVLAGRVKRALEAEARKVEAKIERLRGQIETRKADIAEVDPGVDRDLDALNAALEQAIRDQSSLAAAVESATAQQRRRADAQKGLDGLPPSRLGELTDSEAVLAEECLALQDGVNAATEALRKAESDYRAHMSELEKVRIELRGEKSRQESLAAYQAILDAEVLPMPTEEDRLRADRAVYDARAAIQRATIALEMDRKAGELAGLRTEAGDLEKRAERLREHAAGTEQVLSDAIASLDIPLHVVEGRLCTVTGRGETPYAELSHGERWKLAIDLGVRRVGDNGVIVIPQEAWEGLQPANKAVIHQHAIERKVCIITAACDDGNLRCERYQEIPEKSDQSQESA